MGYRARGVLEGYDLGGSIGVGSSCREAGGSRDPTVRRSRRLFISSHARRYVLDFLNSETERWSLRLPVVSCHSSRRWVTTRVLQVTRIGGARWTAGLGSASRRVPRSR